MLDFVKAKELLKKHGQEHVLRFFDELDEDGRRGLLRQIEDVDFDMLDVIHHPKQEEKGKISPLKPSVPPGKSPPP